jgi:hypothetical protein
MRERRGHILLLCIGLATAGHAGCAHVETSAGNTSTATFGAMCAADTDCMPGLRCITSSASEPALGGGPANGYCSKTCTMDSDCAADADARCGVDANGQHGICVLTCTIGPALTFANDPLDPAKCHGRDDVRCTPGDINTNLCLPNCEADSQCPPGRVCDPRLTVCVDKASTGEPIGAPCDLMATVSECAGTCVSFIQGVTACSSACVLGGIFDPVTTPSCGGVERGFCLYRENANGAGDIGFCAPACNKQDECQAPGFWCLGLGGFTGTYVDNGYCTGTEACPNGQSDCKYPNQTCALTKLGPFCIDAAFPLGSLAPDAGG